jgi:putative two-component system response regulator
MDKTLLLVDDEPLNLKVLGELLRPHYQVLAAISGQNALNILATPPLPDLILLDVMMPKMDGYDLLKRLKATPALSQIPVIFITAQHEEIDETHGFELGAVDYIHKPIRPTIVMARIAAQLELKEARDRLSEQNHWLEDEIGRRMEENQIIQDIGIRALAYLAETRDPETGNHILRTQEYVAILARRLRSHPRFSAGLSEYSIQLLVKSAPLHDIGKVGIPDTILLKPGKLDAKEMAIMQTHAKLGAIAIEKAVHDSGRSVEYLDMARDIAHWHHEKWDGSGYPDGLSGDDIPLSARLMALADVFDALISRRVYKAAFSFDKARDIIVEGRGQHFDPDVVDVFMAGFNEFVAVAEGFSDPPKQA